jgi:hypothetical protein
VKVEIWKLTCACGTEFTGTLRDPCPGCGKVRGATTEGDPAIIEPLRLAFSRQEAIDHATEWLRKKRKAGDVTLGAYYMHMGLMTDLFSDMFADR